MAQIYTNTTKRTLNLGGAVNVKPGQFSVDGKLARRLKKSALFGSYKSDGSIVNGVPSKDGKTKADMKAQGKNPDTMDAMMKRAKADMKAAPSTGKTKLTAEKPKAEGNGPN